MSAIARYSISRCMVQCACDEAFALTGCSPWNVPRNTTRICDPMMQHQFFQYYYTNGTKSPKCKECLPDCECTSYGTKISSAPLRRCDGLNHGSSVLCLISHKDDFAPQMWADLAIEVR